MPDSDRHANTVHGQRGMLSMRYADNPNTLVSSNLQLEDRDGKRRDVVVPDVFVVFGVPAKDRDSYKIWEEGKVPDFVLEVASKGTYEKDVGSKKDKYERMGVREYCVFDPQGDLHRPRLQLFRLEGGVYTSVSGRSGSDSLLAVTSETLGLELRLEDDRLRLWDPETQKYLLEHQDERTERLEERKGRLEEHDKRIAAEQWARDLETELAELKARLRERP